MFQVVTREMEWAGRKLSLQTGKIARQADGAVLVKYGDTTVLCTAVWSKKAQEGANFFPLRVDYQEKFFAAGRIPGGFFKREGRPSEVETLNSRLIDRPIRPLFPEGFKNDVHLVTTVLVYDGVNNPAIPAMVGASAALCLSGVPFQGPIAAAQVGIIDDELVLNPAKPDANDENAPTSTLDLFVAGTKDGVLMVESEAHELSEAKMLEAVMFGHKGMQDVIALIEDLAREAGKPVHTFNPPSAPAFDSDEEKAISAGCSAIAKAYTEVDKQQRVALLESAKSEAVAAVKEENRDHAAQALNDFSHKHVREQLLNTHKRIDGRGLSDIRAITCDHGILPRVHGSALFTRGETQALAVTTLGTTQDEQIIDSIEGESRQGFLLHYNFPPYSVGEGGGMRPPGRREVGHGKLAWRALHPLMPHKDRFPYTVRVVSEITESNGSSSMATVCGGSIAMLDAGVPLARHCAGIAMGLIKEGDKVAVLSDILGDEDHLGDMDFKVAGTERGITALQMDIKITSITEKIMEQALAQAKEGRLHILTLMNKSITQERQAVSAYAPQVVKLSIPRDKIRDVIGPGGRIIREITASTGSRVDIDDDGTVQISSNNEESIKSAVAWIEKITAKPEVGKIYHGTVVRVVDFGAFVNILEGQDGLLHISEIADRRINRVEDVIKLHEKVFVKCTDIDDRGRVRLSMKGIEQQG